MRGTQGIALHNRNAENWCTEEKHFMKCILNGIFMEHILNHKHLKYIFQETILVLERTL